MRGGTRSSGRNSLTFRKRNDLRCESRSTGIYTFIEQVSMDRNCLKPPGESEQRGGKKTPKKTD